MNSNIEYYILTLIFFFAVNGLQVIGLDMQLGQAGIFNLAFIVFVAVGAYATGIASVHPANLSNGSAVTYIGGFGWGFPWNMLFGVACTIGFGLVLSGIAFRRLREDYLALTLVTIGAAILLLITNETSIFNGEDGIIGVTGPWQSSLSTGAWQIVMSLLALAVLLASYLLFRQVERSPLGRLFKAVRGDDILVASLGKSPFRLKMTAFLLGATVGGFAGSLLILFVGGWGPGGWQPGETFVLLAAVIFGGRGRISGALLGSFVLMTVLLQGGLLLNLPLSPGILPAIQQIIIVIALFAVLWFRPRGLLPEKREKFPRTVAELPSPDGPDGSRADDEAIFAETVDGGSAGAS